MAQPRNMSEAASFPVGTRNCRTKYYLDLKEGDSLIIEPIGLKIAVVGLEGGFLEILSGRGRTRIPPKQRVCVGPNICLHNFYGKRRKGGARLHMGLDVPSCFDYECFVRRNGSAIKLEPAERFYREGQF